MIRRRRKSPQQQTLQKIYRKNERINVPKVMVIDADNNQLGILSTKQALDLAKEADLDLVEVSPLANPPVCKIMEYGQFVYQQAKKAQAQKANLKKAELKQVRLSYRIGQHDLEIKIDNAKKFLNKGHKVQLDMILKRREKAHTKEAIAKMNEFATMLADSGKIDGQIQVNGGRLAISLLPLAGNIKITGKKNDEENND
jgi:translation initiation factor IF-3